MPIAYFYTWMLVFLRAMGIVILLPQMAGRSPPIMVRIGLAMGLATLLSGSVPAAPVPLTNWDLIRGAGGEIILGLVFGFVGQLAFLAVDMAGRIASSEVGLSASPGMGTPSIATEPLAGFLSAFAVILFFLFGGHLLVITAFARSFHFAAPGAASLNAESSSLMIEQTAHVIELGLRMAAPFLALNFLVTLAFSVLARTVPRLGVFVLSAPIRGMAGLALFAGAGGLIARYLYTEFQMMPARMLSFGAH